MKMAMAMPRMITILCFFSVVSVATASSPLATQSSTTVVVDGSSEWKNPSVHVGDTIIFRHKYHYNLYIFKNRRAFSLCNFTQATLLSQPPSSSFTWHPSRPGFFYFTFKNGSLDACQDNQKLAIEVFPNISPPPENLVVSPQESPPTAAPAAPAPTSGGIVSSSPAFPWPFRPREAELSPGPAPGLASSPATLPTLVPDAGGAIPFINSNPAVPLPTGEVDSATIRPLPTYASGQTRQAVVGLLELQLQMALLLCAVLLLMVK